MPAASGRIGPVARRAGRTPASSAVKAAPAKQATATKAPTNKVAAKKAPAKSTAKATAPATRGAAKKAVKKAPAKKAPATKAVAKKAPARKAPAKAAPVKKAPAKKAPVKSVAADKAPGARAPVRAPAKKASAAKGPAPKATAKTAPAKKVAVASSNGSTPQRAKPAAAKKLAAGRLAVPRGSDWTPTELADVRTRLIVDLGQMQGEYDQSMQELNDLQQANSDGAGDDQADAGSKTFEREQELSIAANRLDLLAQIQRAVERIDAGTYGYCESCGKPIPKARLKAFPMATLDVVCKQREERR